MAHGVVSGGRGYTAAAGLGVCVAPCLQTFQTKPDTSAARGRLCGRVAGVRQMPWLRVQGRIMFRIPAAAVSMVAVGDADMGCLFKREKDEWLRLRSTVSRS